MTRLTPEDVKKIPKNIARYDIELKAKVGASIAEIAGKAVGLRESLRKVLQDYKATVVPITSGRGIIEGFAEAVASILEYLGLKAEVAERPDVAGLAEAVAKRSNIIYAADDMVFAGFNLKLLKVSYNHEATGKAYAAALDLRAQGMAGKPVALIGAGRVGCSAANYLYTKRAEIYIYDVNKEKANKLTQQFPERVYICSSIAECLKKAKLVLLATPGRNLIPAHLISKDMIFSVPAVPIGLTRAALAKLPKENLIHDTLELGVATMTTELVKA